MTTIYTTDGHAAVEIMESHGSYIANAVMVNSFDGFGFDWWFNIGTFKTLKNAIKSAKRQMAELNRELEEI